VLVEKVVDVGGADFGFLGAAGQVVVLFEGRVPLAREEEFVALRLGQAGGLGGALPQVARVMKPAAS